ncbi:SMEK domain-containing protein [Flectobacillus longus]|uniref:SMEK domain-containing protein n=1 Tax=Flectobacillus longus TaxID=2984207 RepID=UPI0024B66150|nr:SMEK domain-containing protein [Flectobacillus longus]MDI9882384.1 SMEK domain-containing protein [Flectobacillus longus]
MNQEYQLYRVSQLLSRFREQVKILNSNGEFSINIHAENILINVLNKIYDCNLENVNYVEGKTYPSIDLRDKVKRIAFQVTSTANLEKVKHTLAKFIENDLYKGFDSVYILIITEKQKKYDQTKIDKVIDGKITFNVKNIIDRTDLYAELNKQNDLDKINSVCELLEKQFSDNKPELDKWDLYCKGLNEYDLFIHNYYKFLDIKGFSPKINNTQVKINLENIYVPLELKIESEIGKTNDELQKGKKEIIFTLENALNDFNKLVVLGDPGSGKSTILKHLAYNICTNRPTDSQFSDLVPVIIKGSEFAKYVSTTAKNLSEYIIDQIDKKYELLFTQKLESNQLLVLVDGVDEINVTSLRHTVVNRINAFIAQYTDTKIIVSSRIVGYKETRLNGYFNHLEVMKFGEKQIRQFITNWYLSVVSNSDNDLEKAKQNANELYNSIRQNKSVLNMASNPLLVTIITLIHYQSGTLPERRASLYDIATSTFLENWVRQRESQRNSNFDKETLIAILAPISYHIHQNFTTGLITESELKTLFQKEYRNVYPYQKPREEAQDLKDIIDFLREDAGFLFEKGLNENGESMFGFVHQTFQEYFTALEFKTRWKEGCHKANFEEYVFNSAWSEVIKLTASLFKFSEQSRLGRQYATNFVKDILAVNDIIPEMYRPLKIVLQILKDDTEIEFPFFIEIIDKIFNEILTHPERSYSEKNDHYREVYRFKHFIETLIETKTYQNYIIERIIKEINNETISTTLRFNLVQILMHKAEVPIVYEELIKILKSDNTKLKELLFNYNVVMPVSKIVFSSEFRDEIVIYINSAEYLKEYDGRIPTQYHCAFESIKKGDFESYIKSRTSDDYLKKIKEEKLLSIRQIQNEKMRIDFINFNVFSIGMSDIDDLKEFVKVLKQEYKGLKLPKIENRIKELVEFKSFGLEEYEIFNFKGTKIYLKKDDTSKLALIKDEKVNFITFPLNEKDLNKYFLDETESYLKFLDLLMPIILKSKTEFAIDNYETLLNFIKYQNTIHWHTTIDTGNVLNFALKILFNTPTVDSKKLLQWIKNQREVRYRKFELEEDFDKQKFISEVTTSKLDLFEKLYLIYLVGEKSDYDNLILPTIESMKKAKSEKRKNEIRDILYEVL